ncbi:MAG: hypothetical protein WC867_05490 [Candidatus Pacearchaeota archaeon]|jgi:hypothetical protein
MNLFENYNSREINALEKLADELTDTLRVIAFGLKDKEIPAYIKSRQLSFEKRFASFIPDSDLVLYQVFIDTLQKMDDENFRYENLDSADFKDSRLAKIGMAYLQFRALVINGQNENADYESLRTSAEEILYDNLDCYE